MEFRAPAVAAQKNSQANEYLTQQLSDIEAGQRQVESLIADLGNAVDTYPNWHPILTAPPRGNSPHVPSQSELRTYNGSDHTVNFVRGFVTCPYTEGKAEQLVEAVNQVAGLHAHRLAEPLYSDLAYPVVVQAHSVVLEADGTIRSRDALRWFVQRTVGEAESYQVAETWWNIRSCILGWPHGSRSSLFVNQHAGSHMRKILEAMNNSGMFGPIKEISLDMLSKKKRDQINETLLRTAVDNWDRVTEAFEFELRGETCKAKIRDTWDDGEELSVRVEIGNFDLRASGYFYPKDERTTYVDPIGKRKLAEKFI